MRRVREMQQLFVGEIKRCAKMCQVQLAMGRGPRGKNIPLNILELTKGQQYNRCKYRCHACLVACYCPRLQGRLELRSHKTVVRCGVCDLLFGHRRWTTCSYETVQV